MHSLRKRVRSIQKEKITLRNEILRVRAEREQVALKMDAVRLRHEVDSRDSLVSSLSSHTKRLVMSANYFASNNWVCRLLCTILRWP